MAKSILRTSLVLGGMVLALVTTGRSEARETPARQPPDSPYPVTLPTGDRVTLADPDAANVSVRPGRGRDGMRFAVLRIGGDVYVIPRDALARVRSGALDRRRFDVTPGRSEAAPATAGTAAEEEGYDLTIRYLDKNGAPTRDAFASVVGWDEPVAEWPVVDPDGTSTVRLPKGRYNLGAYLGSGPDTALLVQPVVDLTGDLTVTLDARAAGPVSLTVPEPSARMGFVDAGYSFRPSYQSWPGGMLLTGDGASGVRIGQVGADAAPEALTGSVAAQWAKPDGADDFTDSPYLYAAAETFPGQLPNGFSRAYRAGEFAAVHERFAAGPPGQSATTMMFPSYTPALAGVSALDIPTSLPGKRVDYLHAGARWNAALLLRDANGGIPGRLQRGPTSYLAGRRYADEWNAGPFGPALGQEADARWQWASRTGDRIDVELPLYGDRAGHAGLLVPTDRSRTALYRDGELVDEFPDSGRGSFDVPAEDADYRLEVADRRSNNDLTTTVSAAWTFRSGHADGDQPVRLPLSAVRFTPKLDANNAASTGRIFELPVFIEGQSDAPTPRIAALTVEVSYDDGKTWSTAPVRAARGGWVATVRHPGRAGYVSLRAAATDAVGSTTVTETIIHAYRLTTG